MKRKQNDYAAWQKSRKRKWIFLTIILAILFVTTIGIFSMKVENVTVEGNKQYTDEEIENHILGGKFDDCIAVVWIKNALGKKVSIPFVQKYDIEITSNNSITINVYEKSLVGYIDYMGTLMYFDKDGIVVESSEKKIDDIPKITGISFDFVLLHEKLPVDDEDIFNMILNVTQTLKKYKIPVDKIYINKNLECTLYIWDAKVDLGKGKDLSDKMSDLCNFYKQLKGQSGTLDMTKLDTEKKGYIFKKDVSK